jgi:hypothetical protein
MQMPARKTIAAKAAPKPVTAAAPPTAVRAPAKQPPGPSAKVASNKPAALPAAQPNKPAPAAKPAAAAKPAKLPKAPKPEKAPKLRQKPVRDSFTMPEADFSLVATLKARALAGQRETKKSELLRAGLHALAAMDSPTLLAALRALEPIKTGRPKKGH